MGRGDNAVYCSIALFSVFDSIRILPYKNLVSIGGVEQWRGTESREVDRNLRIAHCSTVQFSIAPGRKAPLYGPLFNCSTVHLQSGVLIH